MEGVDDSVEGFLVLTLRVGVDGACVDCLVSVEDITWLDGVVCVFDGDADWPRIDMKIESELEVVGS